MVMMTSQSFVVPHV